MVDDPLRRYLRVQYVDRNLWREDLGEPPASGGSDLVGPKIVTICWRPLQQLTEHFGGYTCGRSRGWFISQRDTSRLPILQQRAKDETSVCVDTAEMWSTLMTRKRLAQLFDLRRRSLSCIWSRSCRSCLTTISSSILLATLKYCGRNGYALNFL